MSPTNEILIFTSINEEELAEDLILGLLEQGLIISGTLFPGVKLYYRWEGTTNIDDEFKILIKARNDKYDAIEEYIQEHHHYMAPEIVRIEATFGSDAFRQFVKNRFANQ